MTSQEIRQSFLDFFKSKQHTIVPSAPVIPHGDPTLLFTNAGMNQFKEVFLGQGKRDYTRAADTQKCIRVSGKHNDLEEVGRDTYHHTFFEMLGNWSFGDYYKKEAIVWAWELLTEVWKLPKDRLWITVYKTDDEAIEIWKTLTDVNHDHVLRFGEKENFWEMGEAGPCGPCSEIHIDLTQRGDAPAAMVNAGSPELIEIWNLVFIQNNRNEKGELENLPAKHVDTGMGFERVCAVMKSMESNFKKFPSNYDSDVFMPIIAAISVLSGKEYKASHSENDAAFRVIADHIRALSFAIADGATPSNEGRGYVLRRILRRAARFGRTLGMHEPFQYKLVEILVGTMSHVFPEIKEHQTHIERVIKSEEEGFNQTLDRGLEIFEHVVADMKRSKMFPGETAFKLYDTFGFPLDLTQLLCGEKGLTVDIATFTNLMEEQKERSRESNTGVKFGGEVKFSAEEILAHTDFLGYTQLECEANVLGISESNVSSDSYIILNKTPFYAESGGQVGDTGELLVNNEVYRVVDTHKFQNIFGHRISQRAEEIVGKKIIAKVDTTRRFSIMRHHTATHLMHAALRQVLGTHVHQAGSLVSPEHLRFDFAHFTKVSEQELHDIENIVNEKIKENIPLQHHRNIPFDEAKKMGALMFFGDKYGERVNVVQFGDYSKEFCGGTHVVNTNDIGFFKIRSEGSNASGVRRIEALTHTYAVEYLALQNKTYRERIEHAYNVIDEIQQLQKQLAVSSPLAKEDLLALDVELRKLEDIPEIPAAIIVDEIKNEFLQQHNRFRALENFILHVIEKKKVFEKEVARAKLQSAAADIDIFMQQANISLGFKLVTAKISAGDMESLINIGDTLRTKLGSGIGVFGTSFENKAAFVCVVSDDLIKTKNLQAGKIVGVLAKIVGGGGGGKPHLATAGGKDISKIDEALNSVAEVVKGMMN